MTTDNEIFQPNRRNDLIVFFVGVLMLFGASFVSTGYVLAGGLLATLFRIPYLFIALAVSYFVTKSSGKWHALYIVFAILIAGWFAR